MPAYTQRRLMAVLAVIACAVGSFGVAWAEPEDPAGTPTLTPPAALGPLEGRPVRRIEIRFVGDRWQEQVVLRSVRVGQPLSAELARRALRELTDTGRVAEARAEVEAEADGSLLRLVVVPRRVIDDLRLVGGELDEEAIVRAAALAEGDELTPLDMPAIAARIQTVYAARGFPGAKVRLDTIQTDDPLRVVLTVEVEPGAPAFIGRRAFRVAPSPALPELYPLLDGYDVAAGDRLDEDELDRADRALEERLRAHGWYHARVSHRVVLNGAGRPRLDVAVLAGPRIRLRFEGNRRFDATELASALGIEEADDRSLPALAENLTDFYRRRGFFDVQVKAIERPGPQQRRVDYAFVIREGDMLRVVRRHYPCLSGDRSADDVTSEIDSFLSEALPGGNFFGPVDPRAVNQALGPAGSTGRRVVPIEIDPWHAYIPEVYERAVEHLQDLYRSEGYLSALVGPVYLMRRRCHPHSPPGRCIPVGPRQRPPDVCQYDEIGLPLEPSAPDPALTCVPDAKGRVSCEPEVVLHIPIKLGPRTFLYDVAFEGNQTLVESQLEETAELELGEPLSQVALENARRRLRDAYAEEGFAFADVDALVDLSSDQSRARVRFVINEREPVRVSRIVVVGALRTNESLIRRRIALEPGELYRRSLVRKTKERLESLGVFSTVNVDLEDPTVPAREKVVVVSVQERRLQYLDVKPGFSTGDGFRITFEYGHRNLAGEAIQLTLRAQLGLLPIDFILEDDVRRKYDELTLSQRLERRNSITLELPEIGLGPLFRLSIELIDVRDNARDFGLTKDAAIVTLTWRPDPSFSVQVGGSLELNDAAIFGDAQKDALKRFVEANPEQRNRFRVPQGTTRAIAERLGATWDRRDSALDPTRGTLLSAGVEHVQAEPVGDDADTEPEESTSVFAPSDSRFLRWTGRIAGYMRLSQRGLSFATSFRWGLITHLIDGSRTYPDRLFFLGGVDSMRGYLQDSVIPADIARELLRPGSTLSLTEIVIRGGDLFINPRAELRIPITSNVQTAVFVDSGNLWTDPDQFADSFGLRYSAGTGIRIATPIGPLVFDYGFNVDRVLDRIFPERSNKRGWEDLGAFHFGIGVF